MDDKGISPDDITVGDAGTTSVSIDVKSETNPPSNVEPTSVEITGQTVNYISCSDMTPANQQGGSQVPYQNSIQYWRDRQKPVKEKNLKIYKILAIFAIVAFFPLGIPAFWYSLKLKEDFYSGLEKGDLAECNKRALLVQKLLMLSFTMCLFTVILALALIGGIQGGGTGDSLYNRNGLHL